MGAELIRFSPIRDNSLPLCHGLYLGGGYPELYASSLEQNDTMKQAIRSAIDSGMPTIAECGGFMYLLSQFSDPDGIYNWVGTLSGLSHMTERLTRFGYVEITTKKNLWQGQQELYYGAMNFIIQIVTVMARIARLPKLAATVHGKDII